MHFFFHSSDDMLAETVGIEYSKSSFYDHPLPTLHAYGFMYNESKSNEKSCSKTTYLFKYEELLN